MPDLTDGFARALISHYGESALNEALWQVRLATDTEDRSNAGKWAKIADRGSRFGNRISG
jgi:hypothetical protein